MNVLVLYHSRSGRTAGLAAEVARGAETIDGAAVSVRSVSEVTKDDFLAADAVIAGSPVYFGTMSAELKKVMDDFVGTRRQMEGKVGAAFTTGGAETGGKETTLLSILQAFLIYGMVVVGDPLSAGGHYGVAFSRELDDATTRHAARLGARVATLAGRLVATR